MTDNFSFYAARADQSAADAAAATLDNVRDRALRSEKSWRALAEQARKLADERVLIQRDRDARREAEQLAQPGPAPQG